MEKTTIIGNKVIVYDQPLASRIANKWSVGTFLNGRLELSLEEAAYLRDNKELDVYDPKGKKLSSRAFLNMCEKRQKKFILRYKVFSDLKEAGYIPKTAFKYGGDFRVYNKGDLPGKAHSEWILYVVSEHEAISFLTFAAINRVAHSVKKRILFGVVDDEDSVTYYEVNWVRM